MNIKECFDFLNFWINKSTGAFFTIGELTQIVDRGQMSYYDDLQPKYATSQRIKDALSPFRDKYAFDFPDTLEGRITVPEDRNFLNLLDCSITYAISANNIVRQVPVSMANEDERTYKLQSQIDPVSSMSPVGEMIGPGKIQLYPQVQYRGAVTFLRRPVAPVFAYTIVSGRVIVYDPNNSIQLEWRETDINAVLVKALASIGINLREGDVAQYAQLKTQENFQNVNRL